MKRMLVVLLAAAMSWGVVSVVTAQADEQAGKAQEVARMVESSIGDAKMMPAPEVQLSRLTKGLQLSNEQQKQIRPVLVDEYAKLKVIQQNEDLSPKQIQKQVEVLRSGTIAKMQTYLTPAQKVRHDMVNNEIKTNKQKRMKENRKARIGTKADPPAQVTH